MNALRKVSDRLRDWLVGAIREGTAQPVEQKPPVKSAHVRLMRLQAGASLVADGVSVRDAAQAVGEDPDELRRWLARHRVRR